MADPYVPQPVQTLTNGDVVAQLCDGTTPSQKLAIDPSGRVTNNQGAPNSLANAWPVKPTDGTNEQSFTGAGEAKVSVTQPLPAGSNTIGSVTDTNFPTTVDTNYGTVGASTLRAASQVGNATGAADFNNGATGAQTLRTAANLAVAGSNVSSTNPVPVALSTSLPAGATYVNKYNTTAAVAAGSTTNHDYTVTATKTISVRKFWASASGKIRIDCQTSPDGTTFTTFWTGVSSPSNPNISVDLDTLAITDTGTGSKVRIIVTNDDNRALDVFSTISGVEA